MNAVEKRAEQERNEAWAVIQEFRAILSRPGKRIEACKRVLQNYSSDAHLVDIQRRERALYDPHAGIVKTFGSNS